MSYLIIAHLIGDFLLQNDWMQTKARSSAVCTAHVACYAIPFTLIWGATGWPLWVLAAILADFEHAYPLPRFNATADDPDAALHGRD